MVLEERLLKYNAPSVNLQIALLIPRTHTLVMLTAEAKRARKDGTSAIRCPVNPAADATLVTCTSGNLDLPALKDKHTFGLEARRMFEDWGLGLKVDYVRQDKTYDVELPLYLFKSKSAEGLVGGVVVNWKTGDRGANYSLFVSMPLGLDKPTRGNIP